jgi:hypothetical protein
MPSTSHQRLSSQDVLHASSWQWSDQIWNTIDFGRFGQHDRRLTPARQVTHMKFVHDQLPLEIRRFQRSKSKDPRLKICPCCLRNDETNDHFMKCRQNTYHESGLRLLFRDDIGSAHPLRQLLVGGICKWVQTGSLEYQRNLSEYPRQTRSIIKESLAQQDLIGWGNAIRGFLCKSWSALARMAYL